MSVMRQLWADSSFLALISGTPANGTAPVPAGVRGSGAIGLQAGVVAAAKHEPVLAGGMPSLNSMAVEEFDSAADDAETTAPVLQHGVLHPAPTGGGNGPAFGQQSQRNV